MIGQIEGKKIRLSARISSSSFVVEGRAGAAVKKQLNKENQAAKVVQEYKAGINAGGKD
jgi:hypothetical protein